MFLVDNVFSQETKDCVELNGVGYRGNQQSTSLGLTCMNWMNTTRDYDVKVYPDPQTGVGDHNYCRNPDLAERPWCYIAGPEKTQRQFCKIQTCQDLNIASEVRKGPQKKKDLGTTGYVLGILMMTIIIILGAGITVGYFYKRGRDLKKQHEQRVYEREMQRISLPLSAFSNPTCELVDENTIVITAEQEVTPVQDAVEGGDPLMGPAGTPGA
ncbi:hypothetical protein WMY93_005022 [Mugilogobius chulae]|uniref:Kringle domain-containing protein n=1 Tax=Mugilogobius chulae TaxID=88201 RepID=A0AAW0PTP8_9GOBI